MSTDHVFAPGYRPHLDGLRAVAVYLVVLFHVGLPLFSGGFIGVDVFFVLSGFLVTGLLVSEIAETRTVDLMGFYSRRVRRLLPAALVVLLVTAAVFSAVAGPAERLAVRDDFRAALLYVSNWNFIAQSQDYFGSGLEAVPVLHFWSLAVEEQFYIVWPLLVLGGAVLARRLVPNRWWVPLRIAVVAVAALSLVHMLSLAASDVDRAYYGTDTRAYQLLAGALLALVPLTPAADPRIRRGFAALAGLSMFTLVALATSLVDVSVATRGVLATLVTVQLLLGLELGETPGVSRALSTGPMTYLGRISYGTYLWHWPIIVVATSTMSLGPASALVIAGAGATLLAALSHRLVESPIRIASWRPSLRPVAVGGGLAVSGLLALAAVPALLTDSTRPGIVASSGGSAVPAALTASATPLPDDLDWQAAAADKPPAPCAGEDEGGLCQVVSGPGPQIHVVGDSHALMLTSGLAWVADEVRGGLTTTIHEGCSWQLGITLAEAREHLLEACRAQQPGWPELVDGVDPDVVMLVGRSLAGIPIRPLDPDGESFQPDTPEHTRLLLDRTSAAVEAFRAPGRTVVILEPVPEAPHAPVHVPRCLSTADHLEDCLIVVDPDPTALVRHLRDLDAAHDDVVTLDLSSAICPRFPVCDPYVNGFVTRMDDDHLTGTYARSLAAPLLELLRARGVVPG